MKHIPLNTSISTTHTSTYDLGHWTNTGQDNSNVYNLKHFPKETLKTCQLDNTLHILRTTYLVLLAIQKLTDQLTMLDQSLAIRAHPRLVLSYLRAWLKPWLHGATRQHMCLSPQQNCQLVRVSSSNPSKGAALFVDSSCQVVIKNVVTLKNSLVFVLWSCVARVG